MGAPAGLGIGVVWWPPLDALCRPEEGLIDVVEVESEAFWVPSGEGFRSFLGAAIGHLPQPKLLHGVGAPVGGTCPPPEGHAEAWVRDVEAVRPAYASEHLSIQRFRPSRGAPPVSAGFLLPPAQSADGMALAVENIRRRAVLGGVAFAMETPVSYLPPCPGEWPDGAFVAAVAEAADCGILLDLHNLLCNARNGRQSVAEFCAALPLERVWELHLAGGESESGFFLDAHSGLVEPELMEIAAELVPRLPGLRAIVLEMMPERVERVGLAAIGAQLGRMRELWDLRGSGGELGVPGVLPTGELPLDPETWETLLGCAVSGLPVPPLEGAAAEWWGLAAPAIALYRKLIGEGRASSVLAAAPRATRLLLRERGGAATRGILAEFWRQSPAGYTTTEEARVFLRFLSEGYGTLPGMVEAMAADASALSL